MRKGRDVVVSECGDAMPNRSRLRLRMRLFSALQRLPRMLVSRQVLLFPLLLGNPMCMCGAVQ